VSTLPCITRLERRDAFDRHSRLRGRPRVYDGLLRSCDVSAMSDDVDAPVVCGGDVSMQRTCHFSARGANQTAPGFVSVRRDVVLDPAVARVYSDGSTDLCGATCLCGATLRGTIICGAFPEPAIVARDTRAEDDFSRIITRSRRLRSRDDSQAGWSSVA